MKYYALDKKSLLFPRKAHKNRRILISNSNSRLKRSKEKCKKCPVKPILLIFKILLRKNLYRWRKTHKSGTINSWIFVCVSYWKNDTCYKKIVGLLRFQFFIGFWKSCYFFGGIKKIKNILLRLQKLLKS